MKIYTYILILTLVAVSAHAGEAIHEEADMKANGRLVVSNVSGDVEIKGWSRKKIEVTGELGDNSILNFEVDGNTARVEVEMDKKSGRGWKNYDMESTELVIHVPFSTRVNASTVSADLLVAGIKGAQRLQTVSGDLETQVFDKEAVAKSVSGEVEVVGNGNRLQLTIASVSGDVEAKNVGGEIAAKSVSGDVDVEAIDVTRLNMGTVSGDMDFSGRLETGGRIDADSVSGDVQLRLTSLYNTEYFLESYSGRITPLFDYKANKTSKYAPGSRMELTEGDGESRIQVETMSGDISISASENPRGKPKVQQTSFSSKNRSGVHFDAAMEDLGKEMEQLSEHYGSHDGKPTRIKAGD